MNKRRCYYLLEGNKVNLRIIETDDLQIYAEWTNDLEFVGDYYFSRQLSKNEIEKSYSERSPDWGTFMIEKKDGTKIGVVHFFQTRFGGYASVQEIGYLLLPSERAKGYCTEAVSIILDYLFLLKEIPRIQAVISEANLASQRVLEKNGFTQEGIIRKLGFIRGDYGDGVLYSILREEWGGPKILFQ